MCCSSKKRYNNTNNRNYGSCGIKLGWFAKRAAKLAMKTLESNAGQSATVTYSEDKTDPVQAGETLQRNNMLSVSPAGVDRKANLKTKTSKRSPNDAPPPYHEVTRDERLK